MTECWTSGVLLWAAASILCAGEGSATAPKPSFQNDFFGDMARSFGVVTDVDTKGKTLEVKRERDGQRVRVPLRDDTELHFRDSWGELENYFPGQRVMLFMYVDEDKNWTYPRAIHAYFFARNGTGTSDGAIGNSGGEEMSSAGRSSIPIDAQRRALASKSKFAQRGFACGC